MLLKKMIPLLLCLALLCGCAAVPPELSGTENAPSDDAFTESTAESSVPAPESTPVETPESTPAKTPASVSPWQPETYTPCDWQVTAASSKYTLLPQQRLEAAAARFDHSQCRTLQITEISVDELDEEQRTNAEALISSDLFYVTFFRAEDGRIFFFETDPYSLLAGCYGVNDLNTPIGRFQTFTLYYEGELPENGRLEEACIRSIEYIHAPSVAALRDSWYEAMRTSPDITLYGYEEALDHYLRCMGWQGFEKLRGENGAEYYSNGTVDILPAGDVDSFPLGWYTFLAFPAGQREQVDGRWVYINVYADGRIDKASRDAGIGLVRRYSVSVGKPEASPVTAADQILTTKDGQTLPDFHQYTDTATADTLDKGRFLIRMAHLHGPDLAAGEAQQADLAFIQEYGKLDPDFTRSTKPYLDSILLLDPDTEIKEPDFGRHARQLALWQDKNDPDRMWVAFQDVSQPVSVPWEILGWDGAGRWLEKQLELSSLWRHSPAEENIDCTDADCICCDTLAKWRACAARKDGNVLHSRSGKNDATDRLAQKLLFLALNVSGNAVTPVQDPAALADSFTVWQQADGERYSYTVPDEPPAQDAFYLQTDPTVAAVHSLPAQLVAWVQPAAPDTLLVSSCTNGTWQTAAYPGWGIWLHCDLEIGAIGLP